MRPWELKGTDCGHRKEEYPLFDPGIDIEIHEIMENWRSGRFTEYADGVIERLSASRSGSLLFGRFNDLMLETAWTARRVAELDERLAAKAYGLVVEVILEEMKLMRTERPWLAPDCTRRFLRILELQPCATRSSGTKERVNRQTRGVGEISLRIESCIPFRSILQRPGRPHHPSKRMQPLLRSRAVAENIALRVQICDNP